jgi:hypothetical protein
VFGSIAANDPLDASAAAASLPAQSTRRWPIRRHGALRNRLRRQTCWRIGYVSRFAGENMLGVNNSRSARKHPSHGVVRMRKAFLCHSSIDKDYVRFVAKRLRRANVVYDELSFDAGEDFRLAIEKGLDQSTLFVFFASRDAIASVYCKFEVDLAQLKRMQGGIENQLAIIIDPTVSYSDLPKWMRTSKALVQTKPTQAVRDIEQALYKTIPKNERRPFLGRNNETAEFVTSLANSESKIFVVSGLEGVGRRSFLERACADNLGLTLGPYFLVDQTRDIEDLYLELFEETADVASRKQLAEEIRAFSNITPDEQVVEVVNRLHILCADKNVPCIIDRGGLLGDNGEYVPQLDAIIQRFASSTEDHYLALVHRRRVVMRRDAGRAWLAAQSLPPLQVVETKLLLTQLFRDETLIASRDAIETIAQLIGGYPPAAYFTARIAKFTELTVFSLIAQFLRISRRETSPGC